MTSATADLIFSFITIILEIFICCSSFFAFIMIVHNFFTRRIKKDEFVVLLFNLYILFFITIASILIILFCAKTIFGQIYQYDFQSFWCTFSGFIIIVDTFALYNVFAIQATYRLCRVVYPSRKWLRTSFFYKLIGPIELVIGLAITSPVLLWHDVDYLLTEYYCFVPFTHLRGIIWIVAAAYGIPICVIFFVYLRITIFLHNQSTNITAILRRRQQRDIIAIKRIVITFTCLLTIGFPTMVNLIVANIKGVVPTFSYRIQWLTGGISSAILCVIIIRFTPQVKHIVFDRFSRNRVQPVTVQTINYFPMRTMTTT